MVPQICGKKSRWHGWLKLAVYDTTTKDRVEGIACVMPELVGGLDLASDERAVRSPKNSLAKHILLPV